MDSVYHLILKELDRGCPVVLARVARRHGSAPRSAGAWCVVFNDGTLRGSVGGGLLEARVAEEAWRILESGGTELISFSLRNRDAAESGMVCGGDVDILLESITAESGKRQAIARAVQLLDQGRSGMLFSFVPHKGSSGTSAGQALLDDEGKCWGDITIPEELRYDLYARNEPGFEHSPVGALYFIDPVRPQSSLVIFGGGHVSLPLARMASEVHFGITVVDDREDFAKQERFPFADSVLTAPFAEAFESLTINQSTYLVIVTRGHQFDREVLERALMAPAAYIGMIGSRKKIQTIFDALLAEGFFQKQLEAVYTPIGLDIGAKTPEEIALSIAAELVQVRAGR